MTPGLIAAIAIWAAGMLVCAGLTGKRRRSAIAIALLACCAPFVVPAEQVFARFMIALLCATTVGRTLDLVLRNHSLGLFGRMWLYVALFDVRLARRCRPSVDPRELVWLLGHLVGFGVGWLSVFESGWNEWFVRWPAGLLLMYATTESVHSILLMIYRAAGIEHARVNVFPIRSTTLSEFWGRRWNRVVSGWLREYAFLPFARSGRPKLGIAAAFAGSTGLHLWIAGVPLGLFAGLTMASFFVVHGLALLVERRLGVARWPTARRRTWTILILAVSSPLFVEPMLRIFAALAGRS